jgi:hypothetical protein
MAQKRIVAAVRRDDDDDGVDWRMQPAASLVQDKRCGSMEGLEARLGAAARAEL